MIYTPLLPTPHNICTHAQKYFASVLAQNGDGLDQSHCCIHSLDSRLVYPKPNNLPQQRYECQGDYDYNEQEEFHNITQSSDYKQQRKKGREWTNHIAVFIQDLFTPNPTIHPNRGMNVRETMTTMNMKSFIA